MTVNRPNANLLGQSGAADGQTLVWNNTLGLWVPKSAAVPPGGTTTQVLSKASGTDYDLTWVTPLNDATTTKGDLLARTSSALARLPVGPDGQVLMADAAESTGVKWATAPGAGSMADPTTAKGDLIVRDSTSPTRFAVGADGTVLKADSTRSTGVRWAGPTNRFDDSGDSLWGADLGYDLEAETDTSSLPAGWAWLNQGTATYKQAFGAAIITDTGVNSLRGIEQNLPAGSSWVAIAKMVMPARSVNFRNGGLYVRDGATGKVTTFTFGHTTGVSGNVSAQIDNWNSGPTYSAAVMSTTVVQNSLYLAVRKNSATSWDFLISADGLSWGNVDLARNITAFTASPSKIGFCWATVDATRFTMHWFRVRAALPA